MPWRGHKSSASDQVRTTVSALGRRVPPLNRESPIMGSTPARNLWVNRTALLQSASGNFLGLEVTILRRNRGLAASPPVRYRLKMAGVFGARSTAYERPGLSMVVGPVPWAATQFGTHRSGSDLVDLIV
jgi:hypothetical protein